MRVSHVIISVFVCLFSIPDHEAAKSIPGFGGIAAKFSQWRNKGPGNVVDQYGQLKTSAVKMANGMAAKIPNKAQVMGENGLMGPAVRVANGVRARIPSPSYEVSVIQEGPVQRMSEASSWLRFDVGEDGIDGEQYQELEFALVQYFQEENPYRFHVRLQNFYDAQQKVEKINYDEDLPDVRERGNLKLPQDYTTDPREDPKHLKDCTSRCLYLFGYVMKTIKPAGRIKGALRMAKVKWGTTPTEGVIMPLTYSEIIFDPWAGLKSKVYKKAGVNEFSSYVCACHTRDEIYKLLGECNVNDKVGFAKIKSASTRRVMVYLEKIFRNTDLQLVPHNLFMQALIESMVNNGRGPKKQVEAPQVARNGNAWESERFRRLPTIAYDAQAAERSPSKKEESDGEEERRQKPDQNFEKYRRGGKN